MSPERFVKGESERTLLALILIQRKEWRSAKPPPPYGLCVFWLVCAFSEDLLTTC